MRCRSRALLLWAVAAFAVQAGPVEFGMREVESAVAARGLRPGAIRFTTEITSDAAETYRIILGRIEGGDLRGLMYGLLAAAEQIRANGRLSQEKGAPLASMRGVRRNLDAREVDEEWFLSEGYWRDYIRMLARARINRLNLVFTHPAHPFAPPFAFWLSMPEFPAVRVQGVAPARRQRNLAMLRFIASTCAEHGVDFTLGLWEQAGSREAGPAVAGLDATNIGPYSHAALKRVLAECPAIRSVQLKSDGGKAGAARLTHMFAAVAEAGRRVTLELPGADRGSYTAAMASGAAVRVAVDYWKDWLAHPRTTRGRQSAAKLDIFEKPRRHGVYWQVTAPGGCSEFPWGDPAYVRSVMPTFAVSQTEGFEIDAPAARTDPGHWLACLLWGRLGYDPKTPDKIWTLEFQRRFGAAADALELYRQASRVCVALTGQAPAQRLTRIADEIALALEKAQSKGVSGNREWQAGAGALQAAVRLARDRGRKLVVDDHLAYFDETGDPAALEAARRELREGVAADRREFERIEERQRIHARFGRFDYGFDFGSAVEDDGVAPRFQGVAPGTRYLETRGFGWMTEGARAAKRIAQQASADRLLGDSIQGQGRQVFRVKTGPGDFTVTVLHPGGAAESRRLRAHNAVVDVVFGDGAWQVCGVVVKSVRPAAPLAPRARPSPLPRPVIAHTSPKNAVANRPLALAVRVSPAANVASIRLHYGAVSLREPFKTIDNPATKPIFTIPAADLSARWDLMYYFEVRSKQEASWLDPDPDLAPPYYVVKVEERK